MYRILLCAAACAAVYTPGASAQSWQAEAGYMRQMMSEEIDADFDLIVVRGGGEFLQTQGFAIGAEVEAGGGLGESSIRSGGFDIDIKLAWTLGAYATGAYAFSDQVSVIGRLGFVTTELEADAGFGAASDSASGVSGGVGLRYFPGGGKNGVRVDYTLQKLDDTDVGALSATYVRRF